MTGRVLVCDDEAGVRFALGESLRARGHAVVEVAGGAEALAAIDDVDVVVTDLAMPGMDGLALLGEIRSRDPSLPVIVVTARGSERAAVDAMKRGAYDYLAKPFDIDELAFTVARALESSALRRDAERSRAERATGRALLGESAVMRDLVAKIAKIARRDVPVLVRGETGTGKELVATMLHAESRRATGPLVRFNCAALPAELAEAELFGHTKGAFTGAKDARPGFFRRADGGTIVLDEVGELPLAVQAKLLRALSGGEIQPLGAARTETVDVRVVASTHRDLSAEVRAGRFREDLYFRLAVIELVVPPLRERREDVALLARAFAARYAERFGVDAVLLDDSLVSALAARPWPDNVRELESAIARLVALSDGGVLGVDALGEIDAPPEPSKADFRARVDAFERGLLSEALAASNGNRSEAARRLGLSRVTLLDRLKRLGVT